MGLIRKPEGNIMNATVSLSQLTVMCRGLSPSHTLYERINMTLLF